MCNAMTDYGCDGGGIGLVALFIGALHALPVVAVAAWSKSKALTVIVAAIMVGIGVATGNIAYLVLDLVGVALGAWIGFVIINQHREEIRRTRSRELLKLLDD
ncbi:MAG: hypothetical protein FWH15_07525 [Betaproteobacteria bacterium]|nr:hypothetical protein [Betaproteobacteria bacterium]